MDDNIEKLDRAALIAEVTRLRAGIREHRDSSGHDLCWYDPKLWACFRKALQGCQSCRRGPSS